MSCPPPCWPWRLRSEAAMGLALVGQMNMGGGARAAADRSPKKTEAIQNLSRLLQIRDGLVIGLLIEYNVRSCDPTDEVVFQISGRSGSRRFFHLILPARGRWTREAPRILTRGTSLRSMRRAGKFFAGATMFALARSMPSEEIWTRGLLVFCPR